MAVCCRTLRTERLRQVLHKSNDVINICKFIQKCTGKSLHIVRQVVELFTSLYIELKGSSFW